MAYEWTAETAYEMIEARGAVVNIGQVTPVARKWLDREARAGTLIKYRGYWDTLLPCAGMGPLKTIWALPEVAVAVGAM
jgi:hypothetical protein